MIPGNDTDRDKKINEEAKKIDPTEEDEDFTEKADEGMNIAAVRESKQTF